MVQTPIGFDVTFDTTARRPAPGWTFALGWMLATFLGAIVGPAFAFPVNLALVVLLGVRAPVAGTPVEQALILTADGMGASMLFVGLGMGLGQWLLLRRYVPHVGRWVLATGLAMLLAGLFRWSLPPDIAREAIGPLTVPVGASLLAVCQWYALRGRVAHADRWVIISIGGWLPALAGAIVFAFVPIPLESLFALVVIAAGTILPFAVAAAGMVWLLRQSGGAGRAVSGGGAQEP